MDFLWDLIFPDFFPLQACANFIQMIHKWLVNVCTTESRYFTQTRISMMSQSKCIFIDEIFPRLLVRPLTIKTKLPSWLIQKMFFMSFSVSVFFLSRKPRIDFTHESCGKSQFSATLMFSLFLSLFDFPSWPVFSDLFLHSQMLFLLIAAFSSTDHLEDFFNTYSSIG